MNNLSNDRFPFEIEFPPELEATAAFDKNLIIINNLTIKELQSAPMQTGFFVIFLCTSGEARFSLGGKAQQMKKDDLLLLLGEPVIQDVSYTDDFKAMAVLMSRAYTQDCIVGLNYLWPYLIYLMGNPVIRLSEHERRWILSCHHLLLNRLREGADSRYLRETVLSLTRAFYFEVCSLLDKRNPDAFSSSKQNRAFVIFDQFIRLISENFKRERSVEWYSSEMCLTPKHLSEVVKSVSGRTAGQWITSFVMNEAKTLLKNSDLTIKEIAQTMNFPNQSFLGKYFKNITGMSPSEYRKLVLS